MTLPLLRALPLAGLTFVAMLLAAPLVHCGSDGASGSNAAASDGGPSETDAATTTPIGDGGLVADGESPDADGPLAPLVTVPTVITSGHHTCALRASGDVYCWGLNTAGQLGRQTFSNNETIGKVLGVSGAVRLASTNGAICALLANGTVRCWGLNTSSELGIPYGALAPKNATGTAQLLGLTNVVEIAGGNLFFCARKSDRTVWCWGNNANGELGHGSSSDPLCGYDPVKKPCNPTPMQVPGVKADALALGSAHACARQGTTAVCWGMNAHGELGHTIGTAGDVKIGGEPTKNPTPTAASATGIASLFAGGFSTCMTDATKAVSCWGFDQHGELGDVGAAPNSPVPVKIAALTGPVTHAAPGMPSGCAVMSGAVWCWGSGTEDVLGPGSSSSAVLFGPTAIAGLGGVDVIAVTAAVVNGNFCTLASTGAVHCWGGNDVGQLGHDNATDPLCFGTRCNGTPTAVAGLP